MTRYVLVIVLTVLNGIATGAADFEFVVIGDTRPRFESENFRGFERLIPKINATQPALVINLGDMIYGYGPFSKEKQWNKYQQVIQAIQARYYQIPGNHDTFSREARNIYGRRFGKLYQSFDYQDAHFVLLNNNEQGRWGYLGPAEYEWLKGDLKAAQARSVYVFMHFPVWEADRVASKYHEFWAQKLHPLFRESRVRAVFGGHLHCYGPTRELDGIRYYITGGGGAELIPDYRKSGGEYHFVKVSVTGETHDLRVISERGERTDSEADIMGGLLFAAKHSTRIGLTQGAQDLRNGVQFSLALTNPSPGFMQGQAQWNLDAQTFAVQPPTIKVQIPPGGTQRSTFTMSAKKPILMLESLPWLEFKIAVNGRSYHFHRELLFLKVLTAPFRQTLPTPNGGPDKGDDIPQLLLGDGRGPEVELRAVHNGARLYLAVTIPTVIRAEAEDAPTRDDLQLGFARRFSDTDFGADLVRLGFCRTGSGVEVRDRTPGHKPGATAPGVRSFCRTSNDKTLYEIIIPTRLFKRLRTGEKDHLILNLSFPVPERAPAAMAETAPAINSFSYMVRYGSDLLVPVHFVELTLAGRKQALNEQGRAASR